MFYICIYITYLCADMFYDRPPERQLYKGRDCVCFGHSHFPSASTLVGVNRYGWDEKVSE